MIKSIHPKLVTLVDNILNPFLIKDLVFLCLEYMERGDIAKEKWYLKDRLPQDIAVSPNNLVYLIDMSFGLEIFTLEGKLVKRVPLEIKEPSQIIVSSREVYIVDNHRIYVYTLEGSFLRSWTVGVKGLDIRGITIRGGVSLEEDEIYLSISYSIEVFDVNGIFMRSWPIIGFRNDKPYGIAISSKDEVYVSCGSSDYSIRVYSRDGMLLRKWGKLESPRGIAISPYDEVYVVDCDGANLHVFNPEGRLLRKIDKRQKGFSGFELPIEISISSCGRVYVTDDRFIHVFIPSL